MKLNLSLSQIIRYGYGGFLLIGILLIFQPDIIKKSIDSAGAIVAPIAILSIGACIYIIYRYVIGELIIYPLTHLIHYLIDRIKGKMVISSPVRLFKSYGIPSFQVRSAYNQIRWELLEEADKKRLDFAHSEIHVLYLTSVEFLITYWILYYNSTTNVKDYFLIGFFILVIAGFITDIRQHMSEYRFLKSKEQEIKDFLKKRQFNIL